MDDRISRRYVLKVAAAAGVATVAVKAAPSLADEHEDVLAGLVERVEPPTTMILRRAEGPTTVEFTPDARLWKDRPASLGQFAPGDEVTLEGVGGTGAFVAHSMITTYRTIDTEIDSRVGSGFKTSDGILELVPETELLPGHTAKSTDEMARGDRVRAIYRLDPRSKNMVTLRIGVAPSS